MRKLILVVMTLTAAGAASLTTSTPAAAYDYPWCLQGRQTGYPGECSYTSYAQCMASASGRYAYCGVNPRVGFARQPPSGGGPSNQVHWYTLKRMTPRYKPDEKDDWSLPGETSPEAAIAYFVKDAKFPHRLQLCSNDDLSAEFLLEKRNGSRTQSGASQRLQPGELVETLFVKRV